MSGNVPAPIQEPGGAPAVYHPPAPLMASDEGIDLRRVAEAIYRRRRTLFVSVTVAVAAALGVALLLPRTYVARTSVLVQPTRDTTYLSDRTGREVGPVQSQVDMLREFVRSRNFLEPTLKRLGVVDASMSPRQVERMLRAIQGNLSARATGANTFEVVFSGKDPVWPVRILQATVDSFIAVSTRTRSQQTEDAVRFLEGQMAEYRRRLAEARAAVERFQERHAHLLARRPEDTAGRLSVVEDHLAEARMSAIDAQMKIALITKQLETTPPTIVSEQSTVPNPHVLAFQSRLSAAEGELEHLRSRYTDEHPEVRNKIREVEGLRAQLAAALRRPMSLGSQTTRVNPAYERLKDELLAARNQLETARARERQLAQRLVPVQSAALSVPTVRNQLEHLEAQARTQEALYHSLAERLEAARLSNELEARQQEMVYQLIDPARLVPSADGMRRLGVLLAGLVIGLLLGLSLLGLQEVTDRRVHSVHDLERTVGVPVLAAIPLLPEMPVAVMVRRRRRRLVLGALAALALVATLFILSSRTQAGRDFIRERRPATTEVPTNG